MGLEALMSKHSMVAQRDSKSAKGEEGQKQGNIYPSDVVVPE
jgi:hypothetical protein